MDDFADLIEKLNGKIVSIMFVGGVGMWWGPYKVTGMLESAPILVLEGSAGPYYVNMITIAVIRPDEDDDGED